MLTSLALIFLVGLAMAAICQRLKLPRIIGMLLTGILLGPKRHCIHIGVTGSGSNGNRTGSHRFCPDGNGLSLWTDRAFFGCTGDTDHSTAGGNRHGCKLSEAVGERIG